MTDTALDKMYVEPQERVLDPSLADQSLIDRMPSPTGWRLLILPYRGKGKTEGGLYLPDKVVEDNQISTQVGFVLKMGPMAYKDPDKFGPDPEPWCKEGQWVCIGRYSGSRFKIDGGEVRIINDDEVIATILEPDDIKHV